VLRAPVYQKPSPLHAPRPTRCLCIILSLLLFLLLLLLLLLSLCYIFSIVFSFCFSFIFSPPPTHPTNDHLRISEDTLNIFERVYCQPHQQHLKFISSAPPFFTAVLTILTPISTTLFLLVLFRVYVLVVITYVLIRWNNNCIA